MKIVYVFIMLFFLTGLRAQDTLIQTSIPEVIIEGIAITPSDAFKKQLIDSTIIQQYKHASFTQLILDQLPVFVKTYGSGSLATLSFRGTGASHTQLYWNGVSINSPVIALSDLSILPVFFSDQAEVHYGLSSLVDGSGGLGGSIQLNNLADWNEKFLVQVGYSIGSFGQQSASLKIKKSTRFLQYDAGVIFTKAKNDFTFQNNTLPDAPLQKQQNGEVWQYGGYANVYAKLKKGHELALKMNYFNSDRDIPTIMSKDFSDERITDKVLRSLLEWQLIRKRRVVQAKAGGWFEWFTYEFPLQNIYSEYQIENYFFHLHAKEYINTTTSFQASLNYDYNRAFSSNFETGNAAMNRLSAMVSGYSTLGQKLFISALLRYERINDFYSPLLPSIGLKYSLSKFLAIRTSIARSFRYPSLNDFYWSGAGASGNSQLKPEKGFQYEIGVLMAKKSIKNHQLNTDANVFYGKVDDWIIWLPDAALSGVWVPQNINQVENKGFELQLRHWYHLGDWNIQQSVQYAYTKSTVIQTEYFSEFNEGKQLIYVPERMWKYHLTLNYKQFFIINQFNYTGSVFITTDNSWYLPPYFLVNLSIGKEFTTNGHTFTIKMTVNNLLNRVYQSIAWRPMPGRNYMITINYQLRRK
jgi:outer membrane receptor protein involved in Fe transport